MTVGVVPELRALTTPGSGVPWVSTYMAENEVPSLMPFHASGGSGGANRSDPRGGLAKGRPRKVLTPTLVPFT